MIQKNYELQMICLISIVLDKFVVYLYPVVW